MSDAIFPRDYSLIGRDAKRAVEQGMASAQWYQAPIERARLKELMKRSDGPAIRDTLIWIGCFVATAGLAIYFYPSWWSLPFFLIYGVFYGSSTDSRWHECGHGTAFKTRWMNDAVYQVACFMIMRAPTVWRWSHTRHHTDTIIVGLDPEIAVTRPTKVAKIIGAFFAIPQTIDAVKKLFIHSSGHLTPEELTFVPETEYAKTYFVARVSLIIHFSSIATALYLHSWLPVLLVGPLPAMYGAWVYVMTGITQHGGLAENVFDHRLNSRTVLMNPVLRFIYWNMNYHVEHHMFPMVPYYNLPQLYEDMKPYTVPATPSVLAAYAEIIPALLKQIKDPSYVIPRNLPEGTHAVTQSLAAE